MLNAQPKESPKPLVLVVDDEQPICKTLCHVLQDEFFETITASSGEEALGMVHQHQPELVFLDIWMPGWDGIETLERIKEVSPLTEVIMISGHATISNALEAVKRGAFDLIEKPLDIGNIVLAATRALERREIALNAETPEQAHQLKEAAPISSKGSLPLTKHPGVLSTGLQGRNLGQRTLRRSVVLYGQCLHSGRKSGLVLEPLELNSGIQFVTIGQTETVPAFVDSVESTEFATTIRSGQTTAATIEHLLAALHAYGITNLLIKCNSEVPIFDGSAQEFCRVIEDMGVEEQGGDWFEIAVNERLVIGEESGKGEFISIEPHDSAFELSYELDYPAPVGRQHVEFTLDGVESFKSEIASARTFGFMKDIEKLQKAGLAAGGRLDNFILIGPDKVVNTELRFSDELARHKILDAIGDLFLLGRPIRAKVNARMSGHSDNIQLLKLINECVLKAS